MCGAQHGTELRCTGSQSAQQVPPAATAKNNPPPLGPGHSTIYQQQYSARHRGLLLHNKAQQSSEDVIRLDTKSDFYVTNQFLQFLAFPTSLSP